MNKIKTKVCTGSIEADFLNLIELRKALAQCIVENEYGDFRAIFSLFVKDAGKCNQLDAFKSAELLKKMQKKEQNKNGLIFDDVFDALKAVEAHQASTASC